jgi:hypothetical protein
MLHFIARDLNIDDPESAMNPVTLTRLIRDRVCTMAQTEHDWNRSAADAGYAGSEFYNEPRTVFARIRERQAMYMDRVKTEIRERNGGGAL